MWNFIVTIVSTAAFGRVIAAVEDLVAEILRVLTGGVLILGLLICASGCAMDTEPIERASNQGIEMMREALAKAAAELSAQSASIIGTGSLIEPGYKVTVTGIVGTGFVGESTIRVVGASGVLATAAQQGPPNRNVEDFGASKLPPTELTTPSEPEPDPE